MKTHIIALLLLGHLGCYTHAADPTPSAPASKETEIMEQRWQAIRPDLFGDMSKQNIGAKIRFTSMVIGDVRPESPIVIKLQDGITIQATNVSKRHRIEIATPQKGPPTYVTMEAVITSIDARKRVVSVKATKVEVTWH